MKNSKILFTALAGLTISTGSHAAIIAPYTADADTLHLYHLDDPGSGSSVDDSAGSINLSKQNGATLANAGFAGFDTAGNTNAAINSIIRSSVNSPGPIVAPTGAGGAFTYEAMINVSQATSGNQMIFAMDANSNADRSFQFRINNAKLSFFNLKEGFLTSYATDIPTTGSDAFAANEWFHVAVTYNGNQNTADNLNLYWTRVDASRTEANLLSSHNMAEDLSTTALAVYGVGNDFRTVGSGNESNLDGSIDEVRISGVARGAGDMLFTIPEPSATALLGLSGVAFILRRKR